MIRWSAHACRDLETIDSFYRHDDPSFADQVGREALSAARFLAANPFAGPRLDEADRRKWVVKGTPYILLYRPAGEDLLILRVQHNRQDWRP